MTVKDIIELLAYGQLYEIRGAYSGKTYHKSYVNSKKNLEKYIDRKVPDTPLYTDMRIRGSDANHWCVSVIVIWMSDYDFSCERMEGEG